MRVSKEKGLELATKNLTKVQAYYDRAKLKYAQAIDRFQAATDKLNAVDVAKTTATKEQVETNLSMVETVA